MTLKSAALISLSWLAAGLSIFVIFVLILQPLAGAAFLFSLVALVVGVLGPIVHLLTAILRPNSYSGKTTVIGILISMTALFFVLLLATDLFNFT